VREIDRERRIETEIFNIHEEEKVSYEMRLKRGRI
jgi:hypothetical protein